MSNDIRTVDLDGLQALIDVLGQRGYTVLGPVARDGAITVRPVRAVTDLPAGWGDDQQPGRYRLRRRADDALFGYAAGAQSAKPVFFPADELLWRSRSGPDGPSIETPELAGPPPPYALLGLRSCDLAAVRIHDTVLTQREAVDTRYAARRQETFVVPVTCTEPAGTCFCASVGTGPVPGGDFDIALTELVGHGEHRFVARVGSDRGAEVLDAIGAPGAADEDVVLAERLGAEAAEKMGRTLDTDGLRDLLYDAAESPVWDEIASRCLSCTNCTLVCPTCFCTSVTDETELTGEDASRHRVWDSCFSRDYSYIHGGSVRETTRSRYRQWITHKLASWQDQFGSLGCVGCGRCITWCPAAIDITAEAARLRTAVTAGPRKEVRR